MDSNKPSKLGLDLWDKSSEIIPGGNMLLSKNKNLFSPSAWPCYYSKAKDASVWDLDGNEYFDFTTNGVGACSLGHAYDPVDDAVLVAIQNGVMSSLNTPYEVELAEKLVELNPWSGMVRFARTGGEANAIAIRIARALTGREKVFVCGYHGWHDWYLAANLASSDNLDNHLIKGLNIAGVPKSLNGTTIPMAFNDFEQLQIIANSDDVAAVKIEVARSQKSDPNYLRELRDICSKKNIVLIFDECTSGFREAYGGIFSLYDVVPDMAMFGKALGNGYAISAVVGTNDVMRCVSDSFISSTFWTEAIGPAAACATLREMKNLESWKILPGIGSAVKSIWLQNSSRFHIPINIDGLDALPTFTFLTPEPLAYKTLFTEKMLELGFLASTSFYPTIAHSPHTISLYNQAVNTVFDFLSDVLHSSESPKKFLLGPSCSPTFKRLA